MDRFYAHTLEGEPRENWQSLKTHLKNVAGLASWFAAAFNAGDWGSIAGLWHDLGKYSKEFQEYLAAGGDSNLSENAPKTDHSTAGARHAVENIESSALAHILAFVISGHHSGLLDVIADGASLENRLAKEIASWRSNAEKGLLEISELRPPDFLTGNAFSIAFFVRMVFSCLVDADFLDTEAFMKPKKAGTRFLSPSDTISKMIPVLEKHVSKLSGKAEAGKVRNARNDVFQICMEKSVEPPGVFSLTVPTGGGKTLSSLAFALKHAEKHGMRRIIYVLPFTSIIEQNAAIFRNVFQGSQDVLVLEHHSNFEAKDDAVENERQRLAAENWDATIVVTTSVQFYESLFASRTSKCRKLHNISNAVIVLDEAQTIPVEYLSPCVAALKELSENYHSTVLLCTATQPALKSKDGFNFGFENVREIIQDTKGLFNILKRVETEFLGDTTDNELVERLVSEESVLCVVNTRKHAKILFDALEGAGRSKDRLHLSALMCPAHRREKLAEAKRRLKDGRPCVLVSTQLVEAGVDIDFPVVYRSLAGIDSIAQAAGRCNREGRLKTGRIFVFKPEHVKSESYFSETTNVASRILELFPNAFLSLEAVERYFKSRYSDAEGKWDSKLVLEKFKLCPDPELPLLFEFKTAANDFKLIEDAASPVVIPWGDNGRAWEGKARAAFAPSRELSRGAQAFSVNVRHPLWDEWLGKGEIALAAERYAILTDTNNRYSEDTGLRLDELEGQACFT